MYGTDRREQISAQNSWLPRPEDYIPGEQAFPDLELQTSITRGLEATGVIDKYLTGVSPLSVLVVGLGYNQDPFICPYKPYQIAAYLQFNHVDYTFTLVDKSQALIDDIRARRQILLPLSDYRERPLYKDAWDLYLKRTQQAVTMTRSLSRDVRVREGFNKIEQRDVNKKVGEELRVGVLLANVLSSFQDGLASGKIHTIPGAVEYAPIQNYAPYNFIACTNLLYLLNEDGQKLALANMSRSLAVGGYILISCRHGAFVPRGRDPKRCTGAPLFPEHGGWMTQDKLQDLGLRTVEQSSEDSRGYITTVLEKE